MNTRSKGFLILLAILLLAIPTIATLVTPTTYHKGALIYAEFWDFHGEVGARNGSMENVSIENATNVNSSNLNISSKFYVNTSGAVFKGTWNSSDILIDYLDKRLLNNNSDSDMNGKNITNGTNYSAKIIGGMIYADQYSSLNDAINASDPDNDNNSDYNVLVSGTTIIQETITITKNNLTLKGNSRKSILKLANNVNKPMINVNGTSAEQKIHNFRLEDITLDGNKANQNAGNLIELYYARNANFRNVEIKNGFENGIKFYSGWASMFFNMEVHDNGQSGLYIDHSVDGNTFLNVKSFYNGYDGLRAVESGGLLIIGGEYAANDRDGINFDTTSSSIIMGIARLGDNSNGTSGTYVGIRISSGTHNLIASNRFGGESPLTQDKAILEEGTSKNNTIINNLVSESSISTPISFVGRNTTVINNLGMSPVFFGNKIVAPYAYSQGDTYRNTSKAVPNLCTSTTTGANNWVFEINGTAGC